MDLVDLSKVKEFIKNGEVELECERKNTSLISASWKGHIEIVKYLVEQGGANVEVQNKYGNTPLFYASICGSFEIVKYLVEQGLLISDEITWDQHEVEEQEQEPDDFFVGEVQDIVGEVQDWGPAPDDAIAEE